MRQNGNIQLQDPSASPTFALSRPAPNPDVPPALRRNLFGPHLSRRPTTLVPNASTDRMPDPFQSITSIHHPPQPEIYQAPQQHQQHNVFESRHSPNRSLSPAKSQSYTTASTSIIALDPATGRPQLPVIPQLPARMPEGSEEEEEDEDGLDDEDEPEDDHAVAWRRMKAFEHANAGQHDLELHSSSLLGGGLSHQPRLHDFLAVPGSGISDYEKIESILSEMQSQQKARAKSTVLPVSTSSGSFETPTDGVSARTRGKARATPRLQEQLQSRSSDIQSRVGGVGATLNPADKDELLGLIMTGLSKKVQEADEDAWMFGDEHTAANGVTVSGSFNVAVRDELSTDY